MITVLNVTDQTGLAVCPSCSSVLCHKPMQVAHLLIGVYMALQVNVLSAVKLESSQMIYLTLCYLAILVTLYVYWMS